MARNRSEKHLNFSGKTDVIEFDVDAPLPLGSVFKDTLPGRCCGERTHSGFGLAGGGFGPYVICKGKCGTLYKMMDTYDAQ
jgi:hypothetical protein